MIELLQLAISHHPSSNINLIVEEKEQAQPIKKEPTVVKHKIEQGETLTTIAKKYDTTWIRLFNKNTEIEHPDYLNIGDDIVIPSADEVLEQRHYIVTPKIETSLTTAYNPSFSYDGNTYTAGYCTWAVKNWRPDIPNGLGDARSWYARYPGDKGSTPRVGAVATTTRGSLGHVALVIKVAGERVTLKEMNYKGRYIVSTRTVHYSEFKYLY